MVKNSTEHTEPPFIASFYISGLMFEVLLWEVCISSRGNSVVSGYDLGYFVGKEKLSSMDSAN